MKQYIQHNSKSLLHLLIVCTVFLLPFDFSILSTTHKNLSHVFRYSFAIPLCITIMVWFVLQMPGFIDIMQSKRHQIWLVCGILLAIWMFMTSNWAYNPREALALQTALQFTLGFIFVFVVICYPPPLRWMCYAIMVSLFINAFIGITQTLINDTIGIAFLGEAVNAIHRLPPDAAIEFLGSPRLRSYGLTGNPNILAGLIITQLFWCGVWLNRSTTRLSRNIALWAGVLGLFALLTTFSRGAWGGLIGASLIVFVTIPKDWQKIRYWLRSKLPLIAIVLIVMGILVGPFIIQRFSPSGGRAKVDNSLDARIIFSQIAWESIKDSPIIGIGAGSSRYFARQYGEANLDLPYPADRPHNILLYTLQELGIVGLFLWLGMVGAGFSLLLTYKPDAQDYASRILIVGGVLAMFMAGILDHYPVHVFSTQILWLLSLGYAISLEPIYGFNEKTQI
jgi:O-antigen ligase